MENLEMILLQSCELFTEELVNLSLIWTVNIDEQL